MTTDPLRREQLRRPRTADGGPLGYAVFALARAHVSYAGDLLRELGLHPGQELLLMQLFDRGCQTQSELVTAVGSEHSTVSKSLKRMQDVGLLTRRPATHDRRVLVVSLTPRGEALREPLAVMWATLERAAIETLDEAAQRDFIAVAGAIERSLIRHRETPAPTRTEPEPEPSEGLT